MQFKDLLQFVLAVVPQRFQPLEQDEIEEMSEDRQAKRLQAAEKITGEYQVWENGLNQ